MRDVIFEQPPSCFLLVPFTFNPNSTSNNINFRSSHGRCSVRKCVLRKIAKFTGKYLCQSLFFKKVAGLRSLLKKETTAQVFSCEFCKISKNIFFAEHTWANASETYKERNVVNFSYG